MSRVVDSFGTFLGVVNTSAGSPVVGSPISLDILRFVKEHGGAATTLDILQGVKMPLTAIATTLESLKHTNLIEVHPSDSFERISLTDMGNVVANFSLDRLK